MKTASLSLSFHKHRDRIPGPTGGGTPTAFPIPGTCRSCPRPAARPTPASSSPAQPAQIGLSHAHVPGVDALELRERSSPGSQSQVRLLLSYMGLVPSRAFLLERASGAQRLGYFSLVQTQAQFGGGGVSFGQVRPAVSGQSVLPMGLWWRCGEEGIQGGGDSPRLFFFRCTFQIPGQPVGRHLGEWGRTAEAGNARDCASAA